MLPMLRIGLVGLVFLVSPVTAADEHAAQDAGEAFESCLVGHLVLSVAREGLSSSDAWSIASDKCIDLRALVPPNYNEGGESEGPGAIEEDLIHYWEGGGLYDRLSQGAVPRLQNGFDLNLAPTEPSTQF